MRVGAPRESNSQHGTAAGSAGRPEPIRDAVRSYLEHLGVERGLSPNTLAAYRRDLDRYLAHLARLGVTTAEQVREEHVSAFLVAVRSGADSGAVLTASSAARALAAVRGLHRFLVLDGRTGHDPAGDVRPPSAPRRLPKAISVGDVERLLEAAVSRRDSECRLRDRAVLELLYGSGARISEAVGLDLDDLDFGGGTGPAARKGVQGAGRAGGQLRGARRRRLPGAGARPTWPVAVAVRRRCSSTCAAAV